MKERIKLLIFLLFLWFFVHLIYITVDGLRDENRVADVGLILGNKVNKNGTLSERLIKRLECGLDLYQKNRIKTIIVSGGFGKEGFYEGTKMKLFLIEKGVPDSKIIVDNFGSNTVASVENTLKLKKKLKFKSLLVISQYYHLTRTKMLFKHRHFENVTSVAPQYFEWRDLYSLSREFFAYYTEY